MRNKRKRPNLREKFKKLLRIQLSLGAMRDHMGFNYWWGPIGRTNIDTYRVFNTTGRIRGVINNKIHETR